jgi:predicted Fe-Mo cluster-binding NifX family protein
VKIAVATDPDLAPARHFGKAPSYIVFTVENGRVVDRQERPKPVCDHGPEGHGHQDEGEADGPDLHTRMSNVIDDCQVVMAGGIPAPMHRHLANVGLRPVIVRAASAEDAVTDFLSAQS